MFPDADPAFLRTLLETQPPPAVENATQQLLASPQYPKRKDPPPMNGAFPEQAISAAAQRQSTSVSQGSSGGGLFSKLRKQFTGETKPISSSQPVSAPTPPSLSRDTSSSTLDRPSGMTPSGGKPGATPTPTAAVRANLTRAIQVSSLSSCSTLARFQYLGHIVPLGCSTRDRN